MDETSLTLFAWALPGFAQVYRGLSHRMPDLTPEKVKSKTSIARSGSISHHPEDRHSIAGLVVEIEDIGPQDVAMTSFDRSGRRVSAEKVSSLW